MKLTHVAVLASVAVACSTVSAPSTNTVEEEEELAQQQSALVTQGPTTTATPIGLALEYKNGVGLPLKVRAGQTFYLEQIDLSTSVFSKVDEGLAGLKREGDFKNADWNKLQLEESDFQQLTDSEGRLTRSRFYRNAKWMTQPSTFIIEQVDDRGIPLSAPIVADAGKDGKRKTGDHFWVRRFRGIQWTRGCASRTDCSGAYEHEQEANIELRNSMDQKSTFTLHPRATKLRMRWTQNATQVYETPIEQIANPPFDYGFSIDVETLTPPGPGGYYDAGQSVSFRFTLKDGSGNRLHPQGSIPSYNDVIFGPNEAGIQYYRAFFDNTWVFWRRKHRERTLIAHLMGPEQNIQPMRSVIPLDELLGQDVQNVGVLERDGVFDQWKVFPTTDGVFGGAFDPNHAGWDVPGSDVYTFKLPANAPAGTYRMTMKGRRTYYGEDIAYTRRVDIQVGSTTKTTATLTTGGCQNCHTGGGAFAEVLHRNPDRATCVGCHAPLAVEHDAPIHSRVHFIHSRSNRFDGDVQKCTTCHLNEGGTKFVSKAACLSCHKSYPADHVTKFGPITNMYVGGGEESFGRCTENCHTEPHPGSGF
ncbi:cytochrome C [Labilithrix luteola]|uniref:cytochrome C n=1 Tax=Labilithrix luteola TaxID=1391654 RepID=UPI0011BADBDD|nr:cytochrome C [Labilithrix luteola]